jgi:hypothetical protein
MVNHSNYNFFLKMKEVLHGYTWSMNSLIQNDKEHINMFDKLSISLVKIDRYLENIYVRFHTAQDGTLRFEIKKKVLR